MVLAELGLTYKTIYLDFSKSKPECQSQCERDPLKLTD